MLAHETLLLNEGQGGVGHGPGAGVGGKRSQDAVSAAGIECAQGRLPAANVRRWGVGNPGCTRNTGILPVFAWAIAAEAKVRPNGRTIAPPGDRGRR